jgi:hypothetical protein
MHVVQIEDTVGDKCTLVPRDDCTPLEQHRAEPGASDMNMHADAAL